MGNLDNAISEDLADDGHVAEGHGAGGLETEDRTGRRGEACLVAAGRLAPPGVRIAEDLDAGDEPREGHALPVTIRNGTGQGRKRHDPGDERPDGDVHGAPEHQASTLNPSELRI